MHSLDCLEKIDPEIMEVIRLETERQEYSLELIASENFVSPAVMAVQSNVMTNKYAEGYPNARYYEGCVHVDQAEVLAMERGKKLFGAEHINVQPHSGTQANMAVYFSLLNPGDTILGMNLAHGGHLSHGSPVSFSGRFFNAISYGVDKKTETIDFDQVRKLAHEHKPKLILAGASAYPREIDFEMFADIARETGACLMADMAHIAGLVAAGLHQSPVPVSDFVTSTTHKTLRGPRGGFVLAKQKHAKKLDGNVFPGIQGGPLMHVIAAKAVAFQEALRPEFTAYQQQLVKNAAHLAEAMKRNDFRLVADGTDTHLILIDMRNKKMNGRDTVLALDCAGITANKNPIPFDTEPPKITSGLRLGTPAVTTRGMKEPEMDIIAEFITETLKKADDPSHLAAMREKVKQFCLQFPLYGNNGCL